MNLKNLLLMKLVTMTIVFIMFDLGFSQAKKDEIISFSGLIDSIPKDRKFIVVNEVRVYISLNTKIMDQKGNIMKFDHLKIRVPLTVEGFRRPEGIYADKIIITKTAKRKP